MAWTVEYIDNLGIVELTLLGRLSGPDLQEAASARIALGKEIGVTNFLINARDLITSRSTTMSLYEIPAKIYVEKDAQRNTRIAAVKPRAPESEWIVQFYEDLCVNRGWRVHMADDREGALDWLQRGNA